jgi:hypothetical protein
MNVLKSLGKFALNAAKSEISNRAKKVRLVSEAVPITQDNMYSFKVGDFVRDTSAKQFYMVLRSKTITYDGVLAILQSSSVEWYYRLEYDPYLGDLARDWSEDPEKCRDKAGADSKVNGEDNTETVIKHQHALELDRAEHDTFTCGPASIHYFPAIDSIKHLGNNCYLPAISELYDILSDQTILHKLLELLSHFGHELEDNIYIWSSTENTNPPCYGEEAFSVLFSPQSAAVVQSRLKSKKAYVIPFKKF